MGHLVHPTFQGQSLLAGWHAAVLQRLQHPRQLHWLLGADGQGPTPQMHE